MSDFVKTIYNDPRTVFTFNDIALLLNARDFDNLKSRINYFIKRQVLYLLRRGVYAKEKYNIEELALKIYKPAYISLEYVLCKNGVNFQAFSAVTVVSYLSRNINAGDTNIVFRKIKNDVLLNTQGIDQLKNNVNIASTERAILDTLYLYKNFYFDNLSSVNKQLLLKMALMYQSKALLDRVEKLVNDVRQK